MRTEGATEASQKLTRWTALKSPPDATDGQVGEQELLRTRVAGAAAGGSGDAESQRVPLVEEAAGVVGAAHDLGLARATIIHSRAARLCHEAGNGADTH